MPSLKERLLSDPRLVRLAMSRATPSMFERRGRPFADKVLRSALHHTVAYPDFLSAQGVDPARAPAMDFSDLPVTSKHEYLDRYPLSQVLAGGDVSRSYVIERSSGHSGGCYYWPRLREQDPGLVPQFEMGMRMYYHVDEVPTLLIATLALGTWVGGVKLASMLRQITYSARYPVTTVAPGVNLEEILQIVRDLSPQYGQTIVFGYPPFLKTMLAEGAARGIDWARYHTRLATTGEGFPEEWREQIMEQLGLDPQQDLLAVIGGYGAADLGMAVANENPFTVLVRRSCLHDAALSRDLFGEDRPPNLFQYDPGSAYIEEVSDELVMTVQAAVPLVRYAIRDLGSVIPFETVVGAFREHGHDPLAMMRERGWSAGDVWPMPFIAVGGRADGTVAVGGANVYPENVTALLAEIGDTEILGHKLGLLNERLVVLLEHKDALLGTDDSANLGKRYHQVIVEGLQRVNSEFRDQFGANPRVADPLVQVYAAGAGPFKDDIGRLKRRYTVGELPTAA